MGNTPDTLTSFLGSLEDKIVSHLHGESTRVDEGDKELQYFTTPAPNAIEWVTGPDYLGFESTFEHYRQYQVIRDYFQLRCPLPTCNGQSSEAKDPWNKSRETLSAENLLVWDASADEDVCPKCKTTRSEFVEDGLLNNFNSMVLISGMRSLALDSDVLTDKGLIKLSSLFPVERPEVEVNYDIDIQVYGIGGWEQATKIYYHGNLPSKTITLSDGTRLVCSHTHPISSIHNNVSGWHRSNKLVAGDRVRVRSANEWTFKLILGIEDGPEVPMADLHVPFSNSYVANGILNHNSGKSTVAASIGTYIEHRMINIGHGMDGGLATYFKQAPRQPFEITFIASTDVQSADTIWAKYVSLRSESKWMKQYIQWMKKLNITQDTSGAKGWLYEELSKDINNGLLNLKINSRNSSSAGLAGRTRFTAFIDELSRFEQSDGRRGAEEAYRVLENSLFTIRAEAAKMKSVPWLGNMVVITSPIAADDKAMTLLKDAAKYPRTVYTGHYATWNFNPKLPRSTFDEKFEQDPVGAMRDFGAKPPTVASPYIENMERFKELAIQKDLQPTASFYKMIHADRTGREYVTAKLDQARLQYNGERYIKIDAGQSFDQFAAACAHGEWISTPEGKQLVTVYDWVFRLTPEQNPRREVWFDFITQVIEQLLKYVHVARIEMDRFQSTYLIQTIRQMNVLCEMKGTTTEDYMKFLNDVAYSRVRMLPPLPNDAQVEPPQMSAQGLAFYELERLERSSDLKTIHNPLKGVRSGFNSDDVATVCCGVNAMVQGANVIISTNNSVQSRLKREQMSSFSSGSKSGQLVRMGNRGNQGRGW